MQFVMDIIPLQFIQPFYILIQTTSNNNTVIAGNSGWNGCMILKFYLVIHVK
jgi:hypothetical protein